ncbi:hypothetical protein C9J47_05670 [Photobacterium indicum]|uniref:Uncharacterized protein n=2 Tax=Photobacterium indicum TaxID=81447 RepID=A0A2T3LFB7_9GAMM|nr:hypothetical protein C9J47_05670 [Photobacterium indicum]
MDDLMKIYGLDPIIDFTWYSIGNQQQFIDRKLPQLFDELTLNKRPIRITVISDDMSGFFTQRVGIIYEDEFLPVLSDGGYFVSVGRSYSTRLFDGVVYMGVKNDS